MKENQILPELPQWLTALLPEHLATPQLLAVTADNRLELIQPDGSSQIFDSLEDAYKASRESSADLNIAQEVAHREGEEDTLFLSFPSANGRFQTLVFGYTDKDRLENLQRGYLSFLELAKAYASDPEDFVTAWNFVDRHPAFWTASDLEKYPYAWEQEGYVQKIIMRVLTHQGKPLIGMEGGSHVPPAYGTHYGDWRLEVTAETYEEAIIEFAKRLTLLHNLDGTDNPAAEELFEDPDWIIALKERLEELKDLDEEDSAE